MYFLFENSIKSIKSNIRMNIIIVLTLFVAYQFFFLVCCYIEDGLLGLSMFEMKNISQSILYESQTNLDDDIISSKDIKKFLNKYSFIQDYTFIQYNTYSDVISQDILSYYLIDENYTDFFEFPIIEGRYFTKEELKGGDKVCVIGEGYQKQTGLNIDDVVYIGDTKLEIIGVMKYIPNFNVNLIPYSTSLSTTNSIIQGYRIAAELTSLEYMNQINWDELGLFGTAITADKYYSDAKNNLFERGFIIIILAIIVLIYALINLINIQISKLEQQKKKFGIEIALGATYKQIFIQFFYECFILVVISILLVFLTEPIVSEKIENIINHYFGSFTFICMLLVSVISSFIISVVLLLKFQNMNITEIIKEV